MFTPIVKRNKVAKDAIVVVYLPVACHGSRTSGSRSDDVSRCNKDACKRHESKLRFLDQAKVARREAHTALVEATKALQEANQALSLAVEAERGPRTRRNTQTHSV